MSAVDQTLTIEAIPPTPLVLCKPGFVHTLAVVEREIANLEVKDATSAQLAASIMQRLTAAGKLLEETRVNLKAPFLAKGREIDEAAKGPAKRIEEAKANVKRRITEFDDAQRKAAAEAERAREAELARLEAIRVEEEKAAQQRAEELAAKAKEMPPPSDDIFDFDDGEPPPPPPKTETELKIEAVKYAPAAVIATPAGVVFKTFLLIDTIDLDKLPDTFVIRTADERKIRATYCTGWKAGDKLPEVPGVRFKIDRQVQSTGKEQF